MNRILCFFILIIVPLSVFSADIEKEYEKLIGKYDVAAEAKAIQKNSPYEFWNTALENDERLLKFHKDMEKKRGAEKEASNRIANLPRFYPQYDESVIESAQGFCDTLLIDMGIADLGLNCSLHIVYSQEVNAFAVLTEDGFAMCITTGLISKKGVNYNIAMGYVAHEFVHGAFLHHIRSAYAKAKEKRKNKLLGGITAGLTAVTAATEAYTAVTYGIPTCRTDYGQIIRDIGDAAEISTLKYSLNYSREQEIEADLLAYRFMENLGCAEEFINGLRILGTQYDELYSEYSDHPTIISRINFLKFIQEHPEMGNKENEKLRKKRLKPEFDW